MDVKHAVGLQKSLISYRNKKITYRYLRFNSTTVIPTNTQWKRSLYYTPTFYCMLAEHLVHLGCILQIIWKPIFLFWLSEFRSITLLNVEMHFWYWFSPAVWHSRKDMTQDRCRINAVRKAQGCNTWFIPYFSVVFGKNAQFFSLFQSFSGLGRGCQCLFGIRRQQGGKTEENRNCLSNHSFHCVTQTGFWSENVTISITCNSWQLMGSIWISFRQCRVITNFVTLFCNFSTSLFRTSVACVSVLKEGSLFCGLRFLPFFLFFLRGSFFLIWF